MEDGKHVVDEFLFRGFIILALNQEFTIELVENPFKEF
jgi:hypothetical protein